MSNQFLKLRRSAIPGKIPTTSSIDFGEIALNTYDGLAFIKKSGSNGEEIVTLGTGTGGGGNITGSQYFVPLFNTTSSLITSSIYQSGSFTGIRDTSPLDPNNPDILLVQGDGINTYNLISAHGNLNNYTQLNVQNFSAGVSASSDVVATANTGTETSYYVNMGINSSNYNIAGAVGNALDAYLYANDTNLLIGSTAINKKVILFTGGQNALANARVYIDPGGTVGINSSNITSGNPESLYIGAINSLTYNLVTAQSNVNNYSQINVQNLSNGANASSDFVASNDSGNENVNYVDMGINSSQYTNTNFVGGPNDAYIYSTGNDLYIGNARANQKVIIFNGGFDTNAYAKIYIHPEGVMGINTNTFNATNPAAITVRPTNATTNNLIQATSNVDNYTQISVANESTGTTASADIVAYNNIDPSGQLAGFVDMGINSTNYVYNGVYPGSAGDAYLFTDSDHLVLGATSQSINTKVTIFAGGISESDNAKLTLFGNNRHQMTGSLNASQGFTGSLFGTASWALNVLTSSTSITAISSSYPIAVTGSSMYSNGIGSRAPIYNVPGGYFQDGQVIPYTLYLGYDAGRAANSSYATFIGYRAGLSASFSDDSVFIGENAGEEASNAVASNFIGVAGYRSSLAQYSNFVGYQAGNDAYTSSYSNFLGYQAGNNAVRAQYSNFIGANAGYYANSSSYSNLIGFKAGYNVLGGANGIGTNNIIIGTNITLGTGRKDSINLGGLIFGTGSYSTTTGNPFSGASMGRVGINQPLPEFSLDVSGSGRYTNGLTVTSSLNAPNITGSLFGTASWAQNALTASYVSSSNIAGTVISASFASTASSADNFTVRGTLTAQTIVAQTITSSTDFVTGSTRFGSLISNTHQFTGSVSITGSLSVNNSSVITSAQTGSMSVATASFATSSLSSSFAATASIATSASFAATASIATSASFAATASFVPTSSLIGNFFVQGGNSFGAQAVLGTNDDQNLVIETSGSTRMFVSSSGNVGIGTTSPSTQFHVQGTGRFVNTIASNTGGALFTGNIPTNWPFPSETNATGRYTIIGNANSNTITFPVLSNFGTAGVIGANAGSTGGRFNIGVLGFTYFTQNMSGNTSNNSTAGVFIARGTGSVTDFVGTYAGIYAEANIGADTGSSGTIIAADLVSTGKAQQTAYGARIVTSGGGTNFGVHVIADRNFFSGIVSASAFTGSLFGTASWAQNAVTSSYVLNAISTSFASTASSADNFTVRGTLTAQTIVVQTITSSTDFVTGSTRFGSLSSNTHQFTGSVSMTGSLTVIGPISGSFTGSLQGTSSWATNSLTSSYANGVFDIGVAEFNSTSSTSAAGTTVVSSINTGSFTSAFYNYTIASGSNARAGQVMSVWSGTTVRYTEVTTTDIGNTSTASFAVAISGPAIQLSLTAPGTWIVKSITNLL